MLKNTMLNNAMTRLADIYKNDPAKLEAMNLTAQIVLEAVKGQNALMEGGTTAATMTVDNLSGGQGKATVSTDHEVGNKYKNAGSTNELATPKPTDRQMETLQKMMCRWAKSDPVACQKWVNETLKQAIESAASVKFSNNLSGDWKQAFDDAVSGKAEKDVKKINEKMAAKQKKDEAKAAADQERQFYKDNAAKERAYKKEESRKYHQGKLDEMRANAAKVDEDREKLSNAGINPDNYKDLRKPGLIGRAVNGVKSWWHKKHGALEEAIARGDIAMIEAIKEEMMTMKSLCEAAGIDFDQAIMD